MKWLYPLQFLCAVLVVLCGNVAWAKQSSIPAVVLKGCEAYSQKIRWSTLPQEIERHYADLECELKSPWSPTYQYLLRCSKKEGDCHDFLKLTSPLYEALYCGTAIYARTLRQQIEKLTETIKFCSGPDRAFIDLDFTKKCLKGTPDSEEGTFFINERRERKLRELKSTLKGKFEAQEGLRGQIQEAIDRSVLPEGIIFITAKLEEEFGMVPIEKAELAKEDAKIRSRKAVARQLARASATDLREDYQLGQSAFTQTADAQLAQASPRLAFESRAPLEDPVSTLINGPESPDVEFIKHRLNKAQLPFFSFPTNNQSRLDASKPRYYETILRGFLPLQFERVIIGYLEWLLRKEAFSYVRYLGTERVLFVGWADRQLCESNRTAFSNVCSASHYAVRAKAFNKLYQRVVDCVTASGRCDILLDQNRKRFAREVYPNGFIKKLELQLNQLNQFCFTNRTRDRSRWNESTAPTFRKQVDLIFSQPEVTYISAFKPFLDAIYYLDSRQDLFSSIDLEDKCFHLGYVFAPPHDTLFAQRTVPLTLTVDQFKAIEESVETTALDEMKELDAAERFETFATIEDFLKDSVKRRPLAILDFAMEGKLDETRSELLGEHLTNLLNEGNAEERRNAAYFNAAIVASSVIGFKLPLLAPTAGSIFVRLISARTLFAAVATVPIFWGFKELDRLSKESKATEQSYLTNNVRSDRAKSFHELYAQEYRNTQSLMAIDAFFAPFDLILFGTRPVREAGEYAWKSLTDAGFKNIRKARRVRLEKIANHMENQGAKDLLAQPRVMNHLTNPIKVSDDTLKDFLSAYYRGEGREYILQHFPDVHLRKPKVVTLKNGLRLMGRTRVGYTIWLNWVKSLFRFANHHRNLHDKVAEVLTEGFQNDFISEEELNHLLAFFNRELKDDLGFDILYRTDNREVRTTVSLRNNSAIHNLVSGSSRNEEVVAQIHRLFNSPQFTPHDIDLFIKNFHRPIQNEFDAKVVERLLKWAKHKTYRTREIVRSVRHFYKPQGVASRTEEILSQADHWFDLMKRHRQWEENRSLYAEPDFHYDLAQTKLQKRDIDEYLRWRKPINKHYQKIYHKEIKRGVGDGEARLAAQRESHFFKLVREQCTIPSAAMSLANSNFASLATFMSLLSTYQAYHQFHDDEPRDFYWWSRLGYDIMIPQIGIRLSLANFTSYQRSHFWVPIVDWMLGIPLSGTDYALYSMNNKTIWNDPQKAKSQLLSTLNGESLQSIDDRLETLLKDNPEALAKINGEIQRIGQATNEEELRKMLFWEGIDNDPKLDHDLHEAMASSLYQTLFAKPAPHEITYPLVGKVSVDPALEFLGIDPKSLVDAHFQTEDEALDRILFYRGYDFFDLPKGYAFSLLTYRTLCLNRYSPIVAATAALSLYVAGKIIFNPIKYFVRTVTTGK